MRTLTIVVIVLTVGLGIDLWRRSRRVGPREPNKVKKRDFYWLILVLVILSLVSLLMDWWNPKPLGNENRPIGISDN